MRQSLIALSMALALSLSFATFADDGMQVNGTLTKIDGAVYVITDTQGVEQRINFDDTTQITGDIAEGKNVEVLVDHGLATSIKLGE